MRCLIISRRRLIQLSQRSDGLNLGCEQIGVRCEERNMRRNVLSGTSCGGSMVLCVVLLVP
jgi:hypothetical protein